MLTFNAFVDENDGPRDRFLLKIEGNGDLQGIIKDIVNRLNLIVKEALPLTISAHHTDHIEVENLVGDVLLN